MRSAVLLVKEVYAERRAVRNSRGVLSLMPVFRAQYAPTLI